MSKMKIGKVLVFLCSNIIEQYRIEKTQENAEKYMMNIVTLNAAKK